MPATPSNSEWLTRKKIIDQKLRDCGWKAVPYKSGQPIAAYDGCAVEEFKIDQDHGPREQVFVVKQGGPAGRSKTHTFAVGHRREAEESDERG